MCQGFPCIGAKVRTVRDVWVQVGARVSVLVAGTSGVVEKEYLERRQVDVRFPHIEDLVRLDEIDLTEV